MPEPISHAEMIAAVKWFRDFAEACVAANGKAKCSEEKKLAGLNAVLAHLERTRDLLTATRRAARSMEALIAELTDPGSEILAAKWELDEALSWLPERTR